MYVGVGDCVGDVCEWRSWGVVCVARIILQCVIMRVCVCVCVCE